ncbi:hypothetical protein LX32DRAFT_114839 [Colletotrichum zoysiae]|uniref:Uncharacterized protein n=1 Tax=Colletotrichum zoysiae TaxID=1216348 RepID=A0AAD9LZM8_9PEZI|nr:hypothetical protein LX32DRAFT_114839 [Colletotrichum zoysiae]
MSKENNSDRKACIRRSRHVSQSCPLSVCLRSNKSKEICVIRPGIHRQSGGERKRRENLRCISNKTMVGA